MSKIKVRFAAAKDMNGLAELQIMFDRHFQALDGAVSKRPSEKTMKRIGLIKKLNFSKKPLLRTLVAEAGGGGYPVGAISFYRGFTADTGEVFHIPYFFIRPEYRGSRAILLLFNAVKKIAKKEKIGCLVFSVYGKNKSAAKLYEHVGAKYWADNDEHFMYLYLAPGVKF